MKMGKRSPIVKGNTLQWVIMHILSHLYYLKDFFHGVRVSCQRAENSCKYFWDLIVLQCVRVQVQYIQEMLSVKRGWCRNFLIYHAFSYWLASRKLGKEINKEIIVTLSLSLWCHTYWRILFVSGIQLYGFDLHDDQT